MKVRKLSTASSSTRLHCPFRSRQPLSLSSFHFAAHNNNNQLDLLVSLFEHTLLYTFNAYIIQHRAFPRYRPTPVTPFGQFLT